MLVGERRHCTFCSFNGAARKYRTKTSAGIINEIEALNNRYGIDWFGFSDSIVNLKWFQELFPILGKRAQPFRISCEVTPLVGKKHLGMMREAGVIYLQPGIESLDTEILSLLNKATKSWQNVRFLKWGSYYGFYLSWWLLDNVPASDNGWYIRTVKLCPSLCHLQPPRKLNKIVLLRFSAYHLLAETYKLELEAHDSYSKVYPLTEAELNNLAYHFQDHTRAQKWSEQDGEAESPAEQKALIDAVVQWNDLYDSTARPVLDTHDTGIEIHVRDTRPCAEKESFILLGEEREVYLACEDGIEEERLYSLFGERGMPASRIDQIVERLLQSKVLLSLDEHFLSLGIPQPSTEPPQRPQYPCGATNKFLYEAINRVRENPVAWWRATGDVGTPLSCRRSKYWR